MKKTQVQSLGWEDPLEKKMATHSNILACKIPWTSVHVVTKGWTQLSDKHTHTHTHTHIMSYKQSLSTLKGVYV